MTIYREMAENKITKDEIMTRMDVIFEILDTILAKDENVNCLTADTLNTLCQIAQKVMQFRIDIRCEIMNDIKNNTNKLSELTETLKEKGF